MEHTILIVDDDRTLQTLLRTLLTDEGYRVKTVDNGVEALAVIYQDRAHPSLILLDVAMPYMDGTAFRQVQQYDPDIATIPVVLMSGMENLQEHASMLNVVDYLVKPIDIDTLLAIIARHCPGDELLGMSVGS